LELRSDSAPAFQRIGLTAGIFLEACATTGSLCAAADRSRVDFFLLCLSDPSAQHDLVKELLHAHPTVPQIAALPSDVTAETKADLLRVGVRDFFVGPFGASELEIRVRNMLRVSGGELRGPDFTHEEEIRTTIGEVILRELETLHILGKAAEFKDQETGLHVVRVAHYAGLIARMIGLDRASQDAVFHSSALHDIGKIGIPDSILVKPGRLSDEEFRIMQTHTTNGHGILEKSESSYLLTGALIALTHHERYDGTGYPMGIAGAEIPLYGRIVCVADVFDALTTRRPYKEPWSLERSFALLESEKGKQFDPMLVEAFTANARQVEQIYRDHRDASAARVVNEAARWGPQPAG
jgi:putative two-component system response regulator